MAAGGNVGVAFALVIGAGLCTTLGACAAFWAKLASPRMLAIGLALSAGVMIYVSFVEIFMQKGVAALDDGGWGPDNGYRWGTALFFGGMLLTGALDCLVHLLSRFAGVNQKLDAANVREIPCSKVSSPSLRKQVGASGEVALPSPPVDIESGVSAVYSPKSSASSNEIEAAGDGPNPCGQLVDHDAPVHLPHKPADVPDEAADAIDEIVTNDHHRFGLQKMGLITALAIAIHNLPEGLATFVAALADPLNGVAIAVAIALHNIPEGVCVAMPVYYATGSRSKGFLWAFLSGLSEPVGGLLGYFVLYGNRMSDVAYGILFCVVAGMMTYISIKELIPTALKYDPHNKVTSTSVILGMVVMAVSLLMFTI